MNIPTLYLTLTEFPRNGLGMAGDPVTDWDAAVDQFAECRNDGQPARVFRLQPDTGDMIDVTDDAVSLVWQRSREAAE